MTTNDQTNFIEKAKRFCDDYLEVHSSKRALLGTNEYAHSVAEQLEVYAFVDDFSAPGECLGRPVVTRQQLDKDCLVVGCSIVGRPLTARKLLTDDGFRNLDYYAFSRFSNLDLLEISYWKGFEKDYQDYYADYQNLRKKFADSESLETFDKLVNFRLTYNLDFMNGFTRRAEDQYFEDFLRLRQEGEIFVDAGGFDGESSLEFVKRCPNHHGIIVLEPDLDNRKKAQGALDHLSPIRFIAAGLWNEKCVLKLRSQGSSSTIADDGDYEIQVDRLDDLIEQQVTFIKMDIEGAEREALLGASNTILTQHPTLAVCVYHRGDHYRVIPEIVLGIRDDYEIYLRHYTEGFTETVMFFVPRGKK
ncbi:MAG: FkbM family methyltransferase [Verrucomicrobiota bacterium]